LPDRIYFQPDSLSQAATSAPKLIEHRPDETAPGIGWTGPLRGINE